MSLLKERISRDTQARRQVETDVQRAAVRPTASEQDYADAIIQTISEQFKDDISREGSITSEIQEKIRFRVKNEILALPLDDYREKVRIEKVVLSSIIGLGPLDAYLHETDITDIVVLRYDKICVERHGVIEETDAVFSNEEHLVNVINRIIQPVGRQLNLHMPMVDARLPDGSRVNATIPPISVDGATLTIRLFPEKIYTGDDYLKFGSLDEKMLYFLQRAVEGKASTIVSGGTGSGKTTLLNMLSQSIPAEELIVTIEDSCELKLDQPHVRRLEARPGSAENGMLSVGVRQLVKNALRMRPDRILVGEIRDETVVDLISAMSTGHEGSLSTVHANSPQNLINARLPILFSMYNDASFSLEAQAIQLLEALDLIVHVSRLKDGSRKITNISHVARLEKGRVWLEDIFTYSDGNFKATGYIPKKLLHKMQANGVTVDPHIFEKGA